jgi:hypothetical protein
MNEQAQNAVNKEKDVEIPAEVDAVVEETNLENCLKVKADPPSISSIAPLPSPLTFISPLALMVMNVVNVNIEKLVGKIRIKHDS